MFDTPRLKGYTLLRQANLRLSRLVEGTALRNQDNQRFALDRLVSIPTAYLLRDKKDTELPPKTLLTAGGSFLSSTN